MLCETWGSGLYMTVGRQVRQVVRASIDDEVGGGDGGSGFPVRECIRRGESTVSSRIHILVLFSVFRLLNQFVGVFFLNRSEFL